MKNRLSIVLFILLVICFGCGKSKQELLVGEWEIKAPKIPNFISSLKLNADGSGTLVRPHKIADVREIPVKWNLDGRYLILLFFEKDAGGNSGDTLELLDVNLKSLNIRKGHKEDVLVRIK